VLKVSYGLLIVIKSGFQLSRKRFGLPFESFDLFFGVDFVVFEGFESAFRFRDSGFGLLRRGGLQRELLLKLGYAFLLVFEGGF